jgi:hypothetical protein
MKAKALSKRYSDLLKEMNGSEIYSLEYEGCVGIRQDKVIQDGEVVDTLDTDKKVKTLWSELLEEEGIATVGGTL